MCPNNRTWCKGPGAYGAKCLKCQSAAVTHEVVAKKQPAPIRKALSPKPTPTKTPVIVPTPVEKPVLTIANPAPKKPLGGVFRHRTFFQTHATRPMTEQQKQKEADLALLLKKDKLTAPRMQGGPIWRGENGAKAGQKGRDPRDVVTAGGFMPWQIPSLSMAQASLKTLCDTDTNSLGDRAYAWQKGKSRDAGYFISTGTNARDAYDGYEYFYRIRIPTLMLRPWDTVGIEYSEDNVRHCHLYTDSPTVDGSRWIAILYLKEKSRAYELLVMNPIPSDVIDVRTTGQTFTKITDWRR